MTDKKRVDPEIPPTSRADWLGAAKVLPTDRPRTAIRDPMTFHVFRASSDPGLFVVAASDDPSRLPPCPNQGKWTHFKSFVETGQPRVGLSEAEAKADIVKTGYHLTSVRAAPEVTAGARA